MAGYVSSTAATCLERKETFFLYIFLSLKERNIDTDAKHLYLKVSETLRVSHAQHIVLCYY